MSVEDYFALDNMGLDVRYEYEGGTIRMMSGGSKAHDDIAFHMRVALDQHFFSGPCSVQGSDMRVQVNEETYYYPDVTVTCDVADRRRDTKLIRSPRLVVEVLSPSTAAKDQTTKLHDYQSCPTMQEVVLFDQYRPHADVYTRVEGTDEWISKSYGPDEEVVLNSLDITVTMAEVYRGVNFDEAIEE